MAIYDAASAIQQPNIVGAYQQGLTFRNALADLAAKRAEEQRQIEIRNGLAQFYKQAQPERREQVPQGMSLLDMASMGAAGPGQLANSPMPSALSPMGRLPNDGYGRVQSAGMIPTTSERVIPGSPASFDYQGAADYLTSRGEIEQGGALAQLRDKMRPQSAKYYGGDAQEVIGQDGQRRLIAMTEAGPVELPYQPVSKPKYKFMDDGTVVNEATMQVEGRIPVGLSPAQQLQARIAFGNQNKPQAITGADGQIYWLSPGEQLPEGVKAPVKQKDLSPTEFKELVETDDKIGATQSVITSLDDALAINERAYSGPGALARAKGRSMLPGDKSEADATIEFNNIISEQALSSLKTVFGGNPTEGERAILIEMQASVDKTPEQRAAIIRRAKAAAERRLQANQQRAEALRGGTYTKPGGSNSAHKQGGSPQYQEYVDAWNRAQTPEQKRAITDRARKLGVVK